MRLAIADDSGLFRDGLRRLLEGAGVTVTAAVSSGAEVMTAIVRDPPDAVLLDVRMPPTFTDEGITTAAELRRSHPGLAVLILSTYAEPHLAIRLFEHGTKGAGYLLKDRIDNVSMLVDAVQRLQAGESVVDPEIVAGLVLQNRLHSPLSRLTSRELEVLTLMAEGHSNIGIGRRLFLSTKTVEANIAVVFNKLDLPQSKDDNRRVLAVLTLLRAATQ